MLENPKRYTITAALPYTNGPIHIGHLAGVYVPSDIYARYLRLQGKDVAFICGSDEHGVAISMKAKKEGITPQQVIDKYDGIIRKSFIDFGISFDNYSRTSSKIHHDTASEFFRKLYLPSEWNTSDLKFNTENLLRTDSATRADYYTKLFRR
jgi:methionyl-tRNA synthetase